jgi:hypothetical protein
LEDLPRDHAAIGVMDFVVVPAGGAAMPLSAPEMDAYAGSLINADKFRVWLQIFAVSSIRIPCSL